MLEVLAALTADIRAVSESVHLMDPDAFECHGTVFDGIEKFDGFPIRNRDNQICPGWHSFDKSVGELGDTKRLPSIRREHPQRSLDCIHDHDSGPKLVDFLGA